VDVLDATIGAIQGHLQMALSVGVIGPEDIVDRLGPVLDYKGIAWSDGREALDAMVTVLPAGAARGLEFDAVVLVEPAQIVDGPPANLNLLYVATTRATQRLTIVYSEELPESIQPFAPVLDAPASGDDSMLDDEDPPPVPVPLPVGPPGLPPRPPITIVTRPPDPERDQAFPDPMITAMARYLADQVRENLLPNRWDSLLRALAKELDVDL
jgi:hypothetical protein